MGFTWSLPSLIWPSTTVKTEHIIDAFKEQIILNITNAFLSWNLSNSSEKMLENHYVIQTRAVQACILPTKLKIHFVPRINWGPGSRRTSILICDIFLVNSSNVLNVFFLVWIRYTSVKMTSSQWKKVILPKIPLFRSSSMLGLIPFLQTCPWLLC